MKDSIILEGKIYISARRAAKIINYAQDYVGQLCRLGKLECKMIGRSWFVTEESLIAHRQHAIEQADDRNGKSSKDIETETKFTIQKSLTSPATVSSQPLAWNSSVVSPIAFVAASSPKISYQPIKESSLPELTKKVPASFSLPKKIETTSSATVARSFMIGNPVMIALLVATITFSGYIFSTSLSQIIKGGSHVNSSVSLATALSTLGSSGQNSLSQNAAAAASQTPAVTPDASPVFNGIGIAPSTGNDDASKAKIKNSFSDEVSVQPDKDGVSGVIKPVFKKTGGNDFVYVLVPVKETAPKK